MVTTTRIPAPTELEQVLATLAFWQREGGPLHLHPGDLGWHQLRGPDATAAALRLWERDGRSVALGMLDGPDLVRLALDPDLAEDHELARTLAEDLTSTAVLPAGDASVEARSATALRTHLRARGWADGDPWVPLVRDLTAPVEDPGIAVEEVAEPTIPEYTAVHRAAFDSEGVTDARVAAMTAGPAHRDAFSLLGRDGTGAAVGIITVWSAGRGRPGLIEPLGVHPEHRGRGHGRALCLAGAARLREAGASSVTVCTPRSLTGAVATYLAAGYRALDDVPDLVRPAP